MNKTDHTECYTYRLHSRDSKGRAACRKAGGPEGLAKVLSGKYITSGEELCPSCFSNAWQSAVENIEDDETIDTKALSGTWLLHMLEVRAARSYLYDDGALSACTEHDDRI